MLERSRHWLSTHWGIGGSDPQVMAIALGALFLAGATMGVISLVLPHPASFDDFALWTNTALAYVAGAALLLLRNQVRTWMIQLTILLGTLVVTRAVYYGEDAGGYYTFWYLWVGVFAFFFFGRGWGMAHLAAIGIAYGWALAVLDASTPVVRWMMTLGSILVAGLLVGLLARRLRGETASAANRAANLEAVGDVARQLAMQSDPRAVGWAVCTAALRATRAAAAVLWRPDPSGSELIATAAA